MASDNTAREAMRFFAERGDLRTKHRTTNIFHQYEYAKDLINLDTRITKYNEMRKADSQIGALLKVLKLPLRKTDFTIEKGKAKQRKFIEKNLKEEMTQPWDDFMRLLLTFMEFGFSTFEKVFVYDETEGYYKWKKFVFLPHATIKEIVGEEDGGLKKIVQYASTDETLGEKYNEEITISNKYSLVFVNDKEGDWYGTSVFRNAYRNYRINDTLYVIDAIRHDRYGVGVPWMRLAQNSKKDDIIVADNVLKNMRSHEYSYMLIPPGVAGGEGEGFGILTSEGVGTDIMKSIQHHEEQMSKSVLAQFLDLGTSQSGNRALGQSFIELFIESLNGYLKMIAQVMTKYAIRQLVDINWGEQDEYPEMKFEKVKVGTVLTIAESLKTFSDGGWLTPNETDENQIRGEIGLEEVDEENIEERKPLPEPTIEEPEEGEIPPEVETTEQLQQGHFFRELQGIEQHVQWAELSQELDTMKSAFIRTVKKARDKQIRALVYDIVKDKKPIKRVKPRYVDLIEKAIVEYSSKAFAFGALSVRKEKKIQLIEQGMDYELQAFMDIPPEILDEILFNASLGAEIIGERTKAYIADQAMALSTLGVSSREATARIFQNTLGTGDRVIGVEFGRVASMFGKGRTAAAQAEKVEGGFYSAIMDGQTCGVCSDADSDYNAGSQSQPYELSELPPAPNPNCEGGPQRCRCIHVYQFFIERGA